MRLALAACLALAPALARAEDPPKPAAPGVDFDGDPMGDLRRLLPAGLHPRGADKRGAADIPGGDPRILVSTASMAAAPEEAPPRPAATPAPADPDPAPPADGRTWRRITWTPGDPLPYGQYTCDPARGVTWGCDILDPLAPRPRGGYYYGLIRGPDGKYRYGKLYLPRYGDSDAPAHNDPPTGESGRPLPYIRRDPPPQR